MATIRTTAKAQIPQKPEKPKQCYISRQTTQLLEKRRELQNRADITYEDIQNLNKDIKKALRKDKKHPILQTVNENLDVRDHWAGIKALKRTYTPQPYNRKRRKR